MGFGHWFEYHRWYSSSFYKIGLPLWSRRHLWISHSLSSHSLNDDLVWQFPEKIEAVKCRISYSSAIKSITLPACFLHSFLLEVALPTCAPNHSSLSRTSLLWHHLCFWHHQTLPHYRLIFISTLTYFCPPVIKTKLKWTTIFWLFISIQLLLPHSAPFLNKTSPKELIALTISGSSPPST